MDGPMGVEKHVTTAATFLSSCLIYKRRDGQGIESRWRGEIFRNRPDRHWDPRSLPQKAYRVSFPGIKRPERGVDSPKPI